MSMPIICSCIYGSDVFSAVYAYEIFLICTCGHYIVIFFVYAYFFHSCDVSSSLFINYPIDIYIKTHSMCGIV